MSSLFDSLSEELFQVLKGSGKTLTLYGSDGNKTYDPSNARRMFVTPGNMMVSVIEAGSDSEVKLYLSASADIRAISGLINTIRQITTRYNVMFNVRKYGRELQPKDFAYQTVGVAEANMWGSTKTSYQKIGSSKLIIRHCAPIREGIIGARGRNILSMFVETAEGERFKFPVTHLSGGRAFARHMAQGGKPHDVIGTQIVELAQESLQLAQANRYIRYCRNILDESALTIRPIIKNRILEIRKAFQTLTGPRGYSRITETGLPIKTSILTESEGMAAEIARLQNLLQIDSNHSLAEALKPVALLTMGEQMTNMNNLFQGVIALGEDTADSLVEALADEYGHDIEGVTRFGNHLAFNEDIMFEDARSYLDLIEAAYTLNENDAVLDYATAWTQARYRASGETSDMDKDQEKSIGELADGLRDILSGNIEMPEYPYHNEPKFRDESAAIRFFLDLYVSQHKLANPATLNYVSTIIDKMAEGKGLDGAEKTIAKKLYSALEDHVDANRPDDADVDESVIDEAGPYDDKEGWDMDHQYFKDNPDKAFDMEVQHVVDNFNVDDWIADEYPFVIDGDEKDTALDANEMKQSLARSIAHEMDQMDYNAKPEQFKNEAEELFQHVRKECEDRGYHFQDTVQEFAEMEDQPEHHGISAGDHVASDMGPAVVLSVEGDLASVEFLHGGTKTLHVDDLEKVPALGGVAEEDELAEWFDSFSPRAVLERETPVFNNWENGIPQQEKKTVDGFDPNIKEGDRVTHPKYGAGTVVGDNGKFVKVEFDNNHPNLPEYRTVTLQPGTLTKAGGARVTKKLGEAGVPVYHSVFSQDDDGNWGHHFDADNAEDAKDEARWLKNGGTKSMVIKVPKDQADWTKVDPNEFVKNHLAAKAKPVAEDDLNELSKAKVADYFGRAASDRARAEREADQTGNKAHLNRRERGLRSAFRKMQDVEEAYNFGTRSGKFTDYLELNGIEDVEVEVSYYMDDDIPMIDGITIKQTGEAVDYDSLPENVRHEMMNKALEAEAEDAAAEQDAKYDRYRDDMMDRKMYGEAEASLQKMRGELGEAYADEDTIDNIFNELHILANDMIQMPEKFGIQEPNWQDDADEEVSEFLRQISERLAGELKHRIMDLNLEPLEETDEALGGDKSNNLINDVKVKHDDLSQKSDDELKQEIRDSWKGRGTLQGIEYADRCRAELKKRGVTEAEEVDETVTYYHNTPENAEEIGWNLVPEYCVGDPSKPYVIHDTKAGTFTYTDQPKPMDEDLSNILKNAMFRK